MRQDFPAGLIVLSSTVWSLLHFPYPDSEKTGIVNITGNSSGDYPFHQFAIGGNSVFVTKASSHQQENLSPKRTHQLMVKAHQLGISVSILIGTATHLQSKGFHFAVITDHINLLGYNPLVGCVEDEQFNYFPDMSQVYDPSLHSQLLRKLSFSERNKICSGIMIGIQENEKLTADQKSVLSETGNCFLTQELVPEAIAAHSSGMKVGCILGYLNSRTDKVDYSDWENIVKAISAAIKSIF